MVAAILSRLLAICVLGPLTIWAAAPASLKFVFGSGPTAGDFARVTADLTFNPERGYGFEPGAMLTNHAPEPTGPAHRSSVSGTAPFYFSATVPAEGNYRVTVVLDNAAGKFPVTIKAELRRLMIENVAASSDNTTTCTFIVNTRTPRIAPIGEITAGAVRLKAPRETTQEAWAWDKLLTLEFNGRAPAVSAVEIEPISVPTIFLLGDSTVCDQSREPYASWGQMLPRFFKPLVAIANHAESGETYRDSLDRRRLDKVISVMKPGDWLLLQFGHNDQKQMAAGTGGPFTTYKEELRAHIAAVKKTGGHTLVLSPMERRGFDAQGKVVPSLADYAQAACEVATEEQVPFIDLNALSKLFYEALGPEKSAQAFAAPEGKVDNTHHNNYGSYELAKGIVAGIRGAKLELARYIVDDFSGFDSSNPDPFETFSVPPSPQFSNQRPLGD